MQAVVGVVRQYSAAHRLVEALRQIDLPYTRVSILSPQTPERVLLRAVPTTEAEAPGIGGTIGSVVGGAASRSTPLLSCGRDIVLAYPTHWVRRRDATHTKTGPARDLTGSYSFVQEDL